MCFKKVLIVILSLMFTIVSSNKKRSLLVFKPPETPNSTLFEMKVPRPSYADKR